MAIVETGHTVIDPEVLGGKPHIAGHRIGVADIALWIVNQGRSPAEIAQAFHLTLGEIHSAVLACSPSSFRAAGTSRPARKN